MEIKVQRPIAKSIHAYLSSVFTLVIIIMLVICGFDVFNHNITLRLHILSVISILLIALLQYWSVHYAWVISSRVECKNGRLQYIYYEVFNILGNSKNVYDIKSISSYKFTHGGRYLVLHGGMSFKGSYQKRKDVKKCIIYEADEEVLNYIKSHISIGK